MSDNQLLEVIDKYLNGEMTKEERARFEILRNENAEINSKVAEHKHFTGLIKQYGERLELEKRLNAIHSEIDVQTLEEELMIHPSWIVQLWRNHHSKISVAASIAIFAVLSTLFFTGYLSNRDRDMKLLSRQVQGLQQIIKNQTHPGTKLPNKPGGVAGTGFAISTDGLIVTDYHVIKDVVDSVYVQTVDGKTYRAKVVYSEPATDIAVLAIVDPSFKPFAPLPYTFKKVESDIGENVFTIGYPRDAMVLGPGFLTANNGLNNDSTQYQLSTPVDYGNSGGPLFDSRGDIIGIIKGKQTHIEGSSFAVKTNYLLKAIKDIPADSLKKPLLMNSKNSLATLNRVQQIKKLQNYVFMVKVYNQ
jgi:serine protease Do